MEKLEYLNKYTLDVNKKVELLTNIEVGDMKEGLIPNEWKISKKRLYLFYKCGVSMLEKS